MEGKPRGKRESKWQLGRITKMIEYKKEQGDGEAKIPNMKVGEMTLGGSCKNDEMEEENQKWKQKREIKKEIRK